MAPNTATCGEVRWSRLGDDGDDPIEVTGTCRSLEHTADNTGADGHRRRSGGIHLRLRRREDGIDPQRLEQSQIGLERAGIAFIVSQLIELQGVDEDRHDDLVSQVLRAPDERQVPLMQRPHGHHDHTALPSGKSGEVGCGPGEDHESIVARPPAPLTPLSPRPRARR
ncbi:hypothetical protein GCM10025876_13620 [Demequina litorisediminis]|uniref:Uncharacterized protein n=1 Tax=Demequina litorisediminis TaxID=1849022 RepID=A0ABQ6IDH7_9MICO|nr:hypothetical protein GCM10025876_13620 [Demequina litorisediminis]